MVVTFVANTSAIGGSEMYLVNMIGRLPDCECRVLMPSSPAAAEFANRSSAAVVDDLPTDGYSLHPRSLARSVEFYRGLQTDILHFNLANPSASAVDVIAARLCRCAPIVITTHTPYSPRTRRERATARIALSLADRVITVCDESRRHVSASGASARKVETIHNGVPDFGLPEGRASEVRRSLGVEDANSTVLGTVARLEADKGLDYLLSAFRGVVGQLPDARLCVVGDGGQHAELEALAAHLGIGDQVVFTPWTRSYLDYVAAFDVFVLPSLCESFPVAILEAMMAAKPVVASDVGGVSEAVLHQETGLLVSPGDPDELEEAILRLARRPEFRARMGEKARAIALSRFSDDTMASRTRELYAELVAERRGGRV